MTKTLPARSVTLAVATWISAEPLRIDRNMELDAVDLLAGIVALLLSGVGVLHNDKAWALIAPRALSNRASQLFLKPLSAGLAHLRGLGSIAGIAVAGAPLGIFVRQ
jgi:hypothetical protein